MRPCVLLCLDADQEGCELGNLVHGAGNYLGRSDVNCRTAEILYQLSRAEKRNEPMNRSAGLQTGCSAGLQTHAVIDENPAAPQDG